MTTRPSAPTLVGAPMRRREDPSLVTGAGLYVDDFSPPGTLHLAVVRSPLPHARVLSVDTEAAASVPGVHLVLRPEDVSDIRMPPTPRPERNVPPRFPLVQGKVLMPGDPVAAVVAESAEIARDAAEQVLVDYEQLPAVGDVEQAMDAPPIHDGQESNVAYDRVKGDREAFDATEGEVRLSGLVEHPRVVPAPMEPRAILAQWDDRGLTVHFSNQAPHLFREELATSFGLPEASVRVVTPFVGGGFGAKFEIAEEEYLAIVAAKMTGRPVKWTETRREHMMAISHGRAQRHRFEVVADAGGRIKTLWLDILVDLGCRHRYLSFMPVTPRMGTGNYDIPVYGYRMRGVWTNRAPRGIYRGAGRPEATLTIERVLDSLAEATGLDPAEVRRRNFVTADRMPYESAAGYTYDSGDYVATLEKLLKVADYESLRRQQTEARAQGRLLGIGLAAYVEVCAFEDWGCARVEVDADGTVVTFVETLDQGQGHRTAFAQLVAAQLGLPLEMVRVEQGDTATAPYGWGTSGSRSLSQGGAASFAAAEVVAGKVRRIAAHLMEAAPEDIELVDASAVVKGTDRSVSWMDVVEAATSGNLPQGEEPGLQHEMRLESEGKNFPYGMHLAVVEVDPDTGSVRLERMWAVDDAGNIVNPMLAEGQRHGGMAQGIGQAIWEQVVYDDDGNLVTSSFMDYLVPGAVSLPSFSLDKTVTPSPNNPLGVKGIGEAGAIGSTPAVLSAVCDAIDNQDLQIPVTAEKVWRGMRQR